MWQHNQRADVWEESFFGEADWLEIAWLYRNNPSQHSQIKNMWKKATFILLFYSIFFPPVLQAPVICEVGNGEPCLQKHSMSWLDLDQQNKELC